MKYILFLVLLLPFTSALAVVPSHLVIEDYGELKVINTRDEDVRFKISGATEEAFVLGADESKIIRVTEAGIVTIEEVYNDKLTNAVSVEVEKEGSNYFGLFGSALISMLVGGVYSWKKIRKKRQQRLKKEEKS